MTDFPAFGKIPRLHKDVVITEKIDGTNGLIRVTDTEDGAEVDALLDGETYAFAGGRHRIVRAGSRNRWLAPGRSDNFGFAAWVAEHAAELAQLGPGTHYGEWFGAGIQRAYGLGEKRFALFNVARWYDATRPVPLAFGKAAPAPRCATVVPVLAIRNASELTRAIADVIARLRERGSAAVPGYPRPEGLVVFHTAASQHFKVMIEGDDIAKSAAMTGHYTVTLDPGGLPDLRRAPQSYTGRAA